MKMLSSASEPCVALKMPVARYAHQVVYDSTTKTTFIHGGNASLEREVDDEGNVPLADSGSALEARTDATSDRVEPSASADAARDTRLDDLWKMTLARYVDLSNAGTLSQTMP